MSCKNVMQKYYIKYYDMICIYRNEEWHEMKQHESKYYEVKNSRQQKPMQR